MRLRAVAARAIERDPGERRVAVRVCGSHVEAVGRIDGVRALHPLVAATHCPENVSAQDTCGSGATVASVHSYTLYPVDATKLVQASSLFFMQ